MSEQIRSGREYFAAEMGDEGFSSATAESVALMRKVQIVVPVRDNKEICGAVVVLFGDTQNANAEAIRNAARVIADILSSNMGD